MRYGIKIRKRKIYLYLPSLKHVGLVMSNVGINMFIQPVFDNDITPLIKMN